MLDCNCAAATCVGLYIHDANEREESIGCCDAALRAERDDASLQVHDSVEDEGRSEHRDGESHIATDVHKFTIFEVVSQ